MQIAAAGVTHNQDWTPYTEAIHEALMAVVPAGCFQMGSVDRDDEKPVRQVCFEQPFWIDVYEVTNEQYGGPAPEDPFSTEPSQPRVGVSWHEALAFCESRGARLPTEAEWEYASRGPDGLLFPWGNAFITDNAVYEANSGQLTWAVGSKPGGVSWVGAFDLAGNVYEWVSDAYAAYPTEAQVNPQGPASGNERVLRGGSWSHPDYTLRSSMRYKFYSTYTSATLGFRCAADYQP